MSKSINSTIRAFAPEVVKAADNNSALTAIAAECHRAKWQFDFSDENRLPISQARDMVKRAFGELHRIGDLALKYRDDVGGSKQP